jgi:hypothetical protein
MAMVTVGAVDLPTPSKYDISISDIVGENTKRNTEGYLLVDRVVANKVKITLGWKYLTNAQMVALQGAFPTFFVSVTYHDPRTGLKATKTFYRSDRENGTFKYDSANDVITGWNDVGFSLIER